MGNVSSMIRSIQGRGALCIGEPERAAPSGWEWVRLDEIARLESGHTPSRSHPEYWDGEVDWVSIPDARAHHGGEIHDTTQKITPLGLANSSARLLPANTVCLCRTAASIGYVLIFGRPMATSQDFVNWICSSALEPRFLQYLLMTEGREIVRFGKGSTHSTIYFEAVQEFRVCIPPLTEQQRIVAKLDELLGRSRRAREALAEVPALLERYRRSVLAAAFRGDLTADWRESAAPSEETSWQQSPLRELVTRVTSGSRAWSKYYDRGTATFVLAGNVRNQGLDLSSRQFVDPPGNDPERERTRIQRGDVLVTIVGANTGDCCEIRDDLREHYVCQSVALVRLKDAQRSAWLASYIQRSMFHGGSLAAETYGAARPHLSLEHLRELLVPLPPLPEQHEIVRRIEAAFAKIDAVAKIVDEQLAALAAYDRATLTKAFRGELVPQDPSDEPASVMLDRIRAERAAATTGSARRSPQGGRKARSG